jgi:hypothetical protein
MRRALILLGGVVGLAACGASAADRRTGAASACRRPPASEWAAAPVGAATFDVNRAARGATSRARWLLAPDSSALLVMDDPVGVEHDAMPSGLLFATERTGRVFRMDSVWSAAPSPDWRRLAVGRGVVLSGQSLPLATERWMAPAARLRAIAGAEPALVAESLSAHSFPVGGSGAVAGVAATLVTDVAQGAPTTPIAFASLGGWRVRWSCDGADLLVGGRPTGGRIDAPSTSERRVSSRAGALTAAPPADNVPWTDGPTLGLGSPPGRGAPPPMTVRGRVIEGRDGRIVVHERTVAGRDTLRDLGPGVPLAATRGGHFILAVAPRPDARPQESPDRAVVYRVP